MDRSYTAVGWLTGRAPSASDGAMRSFYALLVAMVVPGALALPLAAHADAAPAHDANQPAHVTAVAKSLVDALGGDDGWRRARYLRFDWIVERDGKRLV